MTITLSQATADKATAEAEAMGFASVEEYVAHLIAVNDPEDDPLWGFPPGEIEAKCLAALDSGPGIPVTPEFWDDLWKRVCARGEALRNEAS